MPITVPLANHSATVNERFYQPLDHATRTAANLWPCPEFPDDQWLRLGVQRVLETSPSGRAFLQEHGLRFERAPGYCNYFASLKSPRRRDLAREVTLNVLAAVAAQVPDRLADIPSLARYACFAADGPWHQAVAHDERHDGRKMAVGHSYSLDLRPISCAIWPWARACTSTT